MRTNAKGHDVVGSSTKLNELPSRRIIVQTPIDIKTKFVRRASLKRELAQWQVHPHRASLYEGLLQGPVLEEPVAPVQGRQGQEVSHFLGCESVLGDVQRPLTPIGFRIQTQVAITSSGNHSEPVGTGNIEGNALASWRQQR